MAERLRVWDEMTEDVIPAALAVCYCGHHRIYHSGIVNGSGAWTPCEDCQCNQYRRHQRIESEVSK